ncbi:hypothetical protein [Roseitranquillus sediminis]|uniref:hypothetical protein n=1 Tax=Roseitranquillus sediminis TaxID=2809051 RepID=UPI001D0CB349|nr:hypothetical protein [Roseitranquillus sediminis]MBM9594786.1 hypothetical protein [Roseitranquillus sediminis]
MSGVACLAVVLVFVLIDAAVRPEGAKLTREEGAIETGSAILYLVAFALFLWAARGYRRLYWPVPVLILAMAMRELDFDKRFTSEGLLSIKILTYDTLLIEKMIGVLVVGGLIVTIVVLLRRTARHFVREVFARGRWAIYLAAALALTVISKSLDGLGRKLEPLGIIVPERIDELAGQSEEVLELGIPIFIIMSILAAFRPAVR